MAEVFYQCSVKICHPLKKEASEQIPGPFCCGKPMIMTQRAVFPGMAQSGIQNARKANGAGKYLLKTKDVAVTPDKADGKVLHQ